MRKPIGARLAALRVYLLLALVCGVMCAIAPNFATAGNVASILKAAGTHIPVAIGLTLVMVCGQLDLSFGAGMTMGGMILIGLQPKLGWAGAACVALAAGALLGAANAGLVSAARVNSFIATLGTMTVVQGGVNIACKGGTLAVDDFRLGDWLEQPMLGALCPRVIAAIVLVALFEGLLRRTRAGRNLLLVGASPQAAWFAGLRPGLAVAGAFAASGMLAALGGSLLAASVSSANPNLGDGSLMIVIAAVIIGGTSMRGGRGSVVESAVAVLTLVALSSGLSCMGARYEVQLLASGLVLGSSVLYDGLAARSADRRRGQRPDLMREPAEPKGRAR